MSKIFGVLIILCATVAAYGQKYKGDSWATVRSSGSGTLTVIYNEQPGLIYREDGVIKGLCADLLSDFVNFIQTKYNKKIIINYAGMEPVFTELLSQASSNRNVLGVSNVTVTEDRKKVMKFAPSFLVNPIVLLTHKDAPAINKISEIKEKLSGYSAEIIRGSTHVQYMNQLKKDNLLDLVVSYNTSGPEILKKMSSNPKLFTILDFTRYIDAVRKGSPIKRQNINLDASEELAFVMHKETDWDEPWKEFLTTEYKKSAKYKKMIVDNLGAPYLSIIK